MRGNFSPFLVCWFLDLLESFCLVVLYFVVDRVAGFASNGFSISNWDVYLRLFFGGALDIYFDSFTAIDGRICSLLERALNRDGALLYAALMRLEIISLVSTFSCRSAPSSFVNPAICPDCLGERMAP